MSDYHDALRDAVWNDDLEGLQMYMHAGRIDVNHTDAAGQTLLHLASFWGRTEIVRLLISLGTSLIDGSEAHASTGASMKSRNAAGCTALDLAMHWGHSATAEIIRLRGGTSVWEEKMGLLQMQVEDLTTTLHDVQADNARLDAVIKQQREEILEMHTKWMATVDLLDSERRKCEALQRKHDQLVRDVDSLQATMKELKQELHDAQLEAIKMDQLRLAAESERDASLHQRQIALDAVKVAQAIQNERIHDWRAAENAAVIMESQRNQALTDRDAVKLRANFMAVELRLLDERLEFTKNELAALREETKEFTEAKRKEEIRQRRAARALEVISADERLEKLQRGKEYGNVNQKPQSREADTTAQRVQTAAQLATQDIQPDLSAFEEAFVHTIKTFTEARKEKWAALRTDTTNAQSQTQFDALRPLFSANTMTKGIKVNCNVYGKYAKSRWRPATEQRPKRQLPPMK